nr:unnamed protein product [Spirometra erinaceieuropaei]
MENSPSASKRQPEKSPDPINPANWKDLARHRPTWRRTVKTNAVIFEPNHITAIKAKRETSKFQLPPTPHSANAQPPSTCPRFQRTFRVPNGLVGHLRTNYSIRTAPTVVSPFTSPSPPTLSANICRPPEPPLPSSSTSSTTTAPMSAAVSSAMPINTTHNPDTPTNTNTATAVNTSDEDRVYTCPHCDHTFTSHIGLVGHLRIHRAETGEPVPGAPTYTRLHCPHCPRTFMHHVGLFGHMHIHNSGTDRSPDTPVTSAHPPCLAPPTPRRPTRSSPPSPSPKFILTPPTSHVHTVPVRFGLVGHMRIHCTETGEPVPEVSTCTRRIRLHCPHCTRTFIHLMGQVGHMRVHKTCGRQPPTEPHHHILHYQHLTAHQHHPPEACGSPAACVIGV